ncbi:MAG: very short patch repair endonuclease [Chloroflexi bacterium]|nr:very short patch repair endonuclease [Chloroflexota bacterium]
MADNIKPEHRHRAMQAVKAKSTRPERRLFAMLAGLHVTGWKKNDASVFGKPDISFSKQQIAIFVDGCFWHGCLYCHKSLPKTNRAYWKRKISRNIERAKLTNRHLRREGWRVIRIWEHDVGNLEKSRSRILNALSEKRSKR